MDDLQQWLSQNNASEIAGLINFDAQWRPLKSDTDRRWISSIIIDGTKKVEIVTLYDWRTGESVTWRSDGGFKNEEQKRGYHEALRKRVEADKKEQEKKWEEASREAERIWNSGDACGGWRSDYLHKKQNLQAATWLKRQGDTLLIPMQDIHGKLWGIQRIWGDGTKRFLQGQRTAGTLFKFEGGTAGTILLCEGFATGASLTLLGFTTYVSFNASNLTAIATAIRRLNPDVQIIICGDDDRWGSSGKNIGREKAEEAARECGGVAVFPNFDKLDISSLSQNRYSDFNDLHCLEGIDEVRRQIHRAWDGSSTGNDDTANKKTQPSEPSTHNGPANRNERNEAAPPKDGGEGKCVDGGDPTAPLLKEKREIAEEPGYRDRFKKVLLKIIAGRDSDEILETVVFDKKDRKIASDFLKRIFYTSDSAYNMAYNFVKDEGFVSSDGTVLLRYYRDDFYRYKNSSYQKLDDEWLVDKIQRWMVVNDWKKFVGTDKVSNVLKALKTKPQYVGRQIDLPAHNPSTDWMGDWVNVKNIVPVNNGLFDIKNEELIQRSPRYFFDYSLPFDYDPSAKCPMFDKICADIFSSPEDVLLWEEIMGVHIYRPFLIEKMFLLYGQGANGKSVMTTILTALLGAENISNVPIDCFNASNFTFQDTLGKLANIIPDMKEVSSVDEGSIKAFVSGEPMHFNRKNKPSVKAKPSALLTACTNTLPKFSDKTDGTWRRIILMEFKKQIPKEEQDPKYRDPDFWIKSGELPGIFNKAVRGAKRVEKRGYILETENSAEALEDYRQELNHVCEFIRSYVGFESGEHPSTPFYKAFKSMVIENGGRVPGAKTFYHQMKIEAKRMGHEVSVTKENKTKDGYSGKWVIGAKLNSFGEKLSITRADLPSPH